MKSDIPKQKEGAFSDTVSSIKFENETQAIEHFTVVRKRFLDVNSWELFAGEEKASFSLRDSNGKLILDLSVTGNFIRIKT